MGKAVKSDGSVQKTIEALLADFDNQTDENLLKADKWLRGIKENGKERADDLTLLLLVGYAYKMGGRFGKISPYIKYYISIKLSQGKSNWEPAYKAERGGIEPKQVDEPKFPWDK